MDEFRVLTQGFFAKHCGSVTHSVCKLHWEGVCVELRHREIKGSPGVAQDRSGPYISLGFYRKEPRVREGMSLTWSRG